MSEITIDVPDTPAPEIIYVTTLFPVWGWAVAGGLITVLIITVGIVRYYRNERYSEIAKRELEHASYWQCGICGSPQVERIKR